MDGPQPALDRLCDPEFEVSAHYLVGQGGQVWQMVDEADRAWHAGAGSWGGCTDVNSASIGIELCNRGDHPFPVAQIEALKELMRGIMQRWDIPASGVIGHSDMAPGRKVDPGAMFPWGALEQAELATKLDRRLTLGRREAPSRGEGQARVDRSSRPVSASTFREQVQKLGYTATADDDTLLATVRLRFAPHKYGPLDADDMALAVALAQIPTTA